MNRIFYSSAEAVLYRLSDNAERYQNEKGNFKVTSRKKRTKSFTTLVEAFLFYISLEDEADLWDMNNGPTLIERKVKMFLN